MRRAASASPNLPEVDSANDRPVPEYPEARLASLGWKGDAEFRSLLRRALRDAWPAARRFHWKVGTVCELEPKDADVGYTGKDGTLYVKVRDPAHNGCKCYSYSFVLATLLHEMTHLSILGHGKSFYQRFTEAIAACGADPFVRRDVRSHVCAELLNAICENDSRRARALISVLPEAVVQARPGGGRQVPLEYAAHHGRVALTRLLLRARADADARHGGSGVPPLARAAAQGNLKTAQVLLNAGATNGLDTLPSTSKLNTDLHSADQESKSRHHGGRSNQSTASRRSSRNSPANSPRPQQLHRPASLPALSAKGQVSSDVVLTEKQRTVFLSGSFAM